MTYKHLKSFLKANTISYADNFFDLIPKNIKSKIILAVGNRASEASAYLSSIMSNMEIAHSRYIDIPTLELKDRFIKYGVTADTSELTALADRIIKKCSKNISTAELCFILALELLADEGEYLILEMSDEMFMRIFSGSSFSAHTVILTTLDDALTKKQANLISLTTANIFTLSEQDDFDYISQQTNENGVRITYSSGNKTVKFRSDLFGTVFYYNVQEFYIKSFDLNNILPACLAVECARALFNAPLPLLQIGLKSTKLPRDIELFRLSPTILLCERKDFSLDHHLKFRVVTESDEILRPTENTLFCGNIEFKKKTKNAVK